MGLLGHKTDDTTATFFWWLVLAPFLVSFLAIAAQLLTWLKFGVWTKYPLMELFDFEGGAASSAFYKWLHFPTDRLELHAVVAFFFQYPIAIVVILAMGLIIWLRVLDQKNKAPRKFWKILDEEKEKYIQNEKRFVEDLCSKYPDQAREIRLRSDAGKSAIDAFAHQLFDRTFAEFFPKHFHSTEQREKKIASRKLSERAVIATQKKDCAK